MSSTKHTPGPWTVERNGTGQLAPFHGVTGEHLLNDGNPAPLAEREANGRLMAASPDMLAALRAILPYAESRLEDMEDEFGELSEAARVLSEPDVAKARDAFMAAQAAIAAAEGRS